MKDFKVKLAYEPVVVCFASDDGYAPYLRVAVYSMLCNRNRERYYDILILHKDISEEHQQKLLALAAEAEGVTIRLLSVAAWSDRLPEEVGYYYTVEAVYRLLLLGDTFSRYQRILYLDCDLIVNGDVSRLYDTEMGEAEIAAVRAEEFRVFSQTKRAVFFDGYPYNVDNYRTDALGMKVPEDYFNSGVLLFDLEKARARLSMEEILRLLNEHEYTYCDQDVLNMLFDGRVLPLDVTWNYMTFIEEHLRSGNENSRQMFRDLGRTEPRIIHYVGSIKPWESERVLGEYYQHYKKNMEEEDEKKILSLQ